MLDFKNDNYYIVCASLEAYCLSKQKMLLEIREISTHTIIDNIARWYVYSKVKFYFVSQKHIIHERFTYWVVNVIYMPA